MATALKVDLSETQPDTEPPWTRRLDELLLPILRHQIERFGLEASGAGNYYNIRVVDNYVFRPHEIELTRRLLASGLPVHRIDEIGCGLGQMMFLLGWNGYRAIGYESDTHRARAAATLHRILKSIDPELTTNVQFLLEEFPSSTIPAPEPESLVLTTNLVATRSLEQQLNVLAAMRGYPYVVADALRFFDDERGVPQTLELFSQAGMKDPELFYDAGSFGRFFLFRNARG
jgi:hypothetical protein